MVGLIICYILLGIIISSISALLLMNFDAAYKRVILSLVGFGSATGFLPLSHMYFNITERFEKTWSATALYASFLISFYLSMYVVCLIIKDKNDPDLLRIRDILLGQKDYIITYYEMRKKQIDEKLNIDTLEERERIVASREQAYKDSKKELENNWTKLKKQKQNKIQLELPDSNSIILDQEFINIMPSYFDGFSYCINAMNNYTEVEVVKVQDRIHMIGADEYIECGEAYDNFKAFLMSIELNILTLFGSSDQVRVRFRKHNEESNMYELVLAIKGGNSEMEVVETMTPIPFEDSMIQKSFECRQAVIKSINPFSTIYNGNNNTVWSDYITYSFYRFLHDGLPVLTFGISVKNADRYKNLFYFLSYAHFEQYIDANMKKYDETISISDILITGRRNPI